MPSFLKIILQGFFLKLMREKIKQGSLHAVRLYIGLVQQARLVSMAAVSVTTTAAAVLVGFAFVVGSLIWLLPISRASLPYVFMGVGFLFILFGSISLRSFFKEEHWMEMSEAYTLMDKVMAMNGGTEDHQPHQQSTFAHFAKQAAQKMREEAMNKPFPPPRHHMEPQEV